LSHEDMMTRFRELRKADLEYWHLVFDTPQVVEYWLRAVYPVFRQEQASSYRVTDALDEENIERLLELGSKGIDEEYQQLLDALCYELVYVVDGTHRFWEHVLHILEQAELPSALPATGSYIQRVLAKDRSIAKMREVLVQANLRLVVMLINSMHQYSTMNHMNYADAIQDGNMGLIIAINRFDPERGIKFSTFAAYWVKSVLQRGESLQGDVRRPARFSIAGGHVHEVVNRYMLLYNRRPTLEEILEGIPDGKLDSKKLRCLLQAPKGFIPLDLPRNRDEDTTECYMDCLVSPAANPEEYQILQDILDVLRSIIEEPGVLSKRELFCVRLYYGFGGTPHTLQEIGDILGVTRERIRQILGSVRRKLRHALERRQVTKHDANAALMAVHAHDERPVSFPAI
jgi:RNA polymerase primary sigma factor